MNVPASSLLGQKKIMVCMREYIISETLELFIRVYKIFILKPIRKENIEF